MSKVTNNSGGSGSGTQTCVLNHPETEKVFVDFRNRCFTEDLPIDQNDADVAKLNFDSAFVGVCDDRNNLKKAEETRSIYLSIYYDTAISLSKDLSEAHKRLEIKIALTAELGKAYSTAVGKLKEACSKIAAVSASAQSLADTTAKTCNGNTASEVEKQLKARSLDKGYPFKNAKDESVIKLKSDNQKDEDTVLWLLKSDSQTAFASAVATSERVVKVAGIYTFLNVQRGKEYTEKMQAQSNALKKDAEDNLKSTEDNIKKVQKSLGDNLVKLGEMEMTWMKLAAAAAASNDTGTSVTEIDTDKNVVVGPPGKVGPCAIKDEAAFNKVCENIEMITPK